MSINAPRGVQHHQEIRSSTEWRDIRTNGEKFRAWIEKGDGVFFIGLLTLAMMWMMPAWIEVLAFAGFIVIAWAKRQKFTLPFRMPQSSGMMDPNDPPPGFNVPGKAQGIAFFGNELNTDKELWFNDSDMRTHILIFGSTGSGKALPEDTPVLTPTGWRQMDHLAVGDKVLTPDGYSTTVLGVYPQGPLPMMRLTFADGRQVLACPDHRWTVGPVRSASPLSSAQVPTEEEWRTLSTRNVRALIMNGDPAVSSLGWGVPTVQPLDLPGEDVTPEDVMRWLPEADLSAPSSEPRPQALTVETDTHLLWQETYHAWNQRWVRGTARSRMAAWRRIQQQWGQTQGRLTVLERPEAPEAWWYAVQALAWSIGLQARLMTEQEEEAEKVTFSLECWSGEAVLPITWIETAPDMVQARCIKVEDPKGLFVMAPFVATHNTEALISLAFNALVQGSGFIYVDGKADNGLWAKVFSMARSLGREDDLLVINYMTGGRDVFGPQKSKRSNTMNPFTAGSAGALTELLVSLMDDAGGEGGMWKGRAVSLISGIMFALVYLRDNEGLLLDVEVIRDHLVLDNIQKLARRRDLPAEVIQPLIAYLRSLPGYQENAPKQNETALEQHGYLQMQFTRILGSLSDTYGFIFKTNLGEVDFFDVVVNRRILLVLLPALEKSPDELGNLGKIVVASLRQMMSTGLGDLLEGDYEDVIEVKPTNSPSSFMCILDEYGYYVVKGAAVMPAQARGLGFSMIFAGQDYPGFKKNNNAEEAVSTIGNCNIKIFMKIEDPTDTYELFKQSVGEALVSKTTGFQHNTGVVGGYQDDMRASIEKRGRGDLLDLKKQRPGEAHIIFKDTLVRTTMFYAAPPRIKKMQLNHFLRVAPPETREMQEYYDTLTQLGKNLDNSVLRKDIKARSAMPQRLAIWYAAYLALKEAGLQKEDGMIALQSLSAVHQVLHDKAKVLGAPADVRAAMKDERQRLDVFSDPKVLREQTGLGDIEEDDEEDEREEDDEDTDDEGDDEEMYLSEPEDPSDWPDQKAKSGKKSPPGAALDEDIFLPRDHVRRQISDLEEATGIGPEEAKGRAKSTVAEMEIMTQYPKESPDPLDPEDILDIIREIDEGLS